MCDKSSAVYTLQNNIPHSYFEWISRANKSSVVIFKR